MYKIKQIRKAKYLFYKYGIHRFIPHKKLNFIGHIGMVSEWISKHKDLKFSSFPQKSFFYGKRLELYTFLKETEILDEEIDYLEFGVSEGHSFKWWVENIKSNSSAFYGFDTFTGLPEDWGHFKKGDMSNGNEQPEINDTRHTFYQGIFQDTLYNFLQTYKRKKKLVMHLDADLYSSTLFVLTTMSHYLRPGDIIIFDEFNVPMHEFKAFSEWVNSFYINYTVLGEVNNYFQVAIKIN